MTQQIPLKSGTRYTIYSLDTVSKVARKREITFYSNIQEYSPLDASRVAVGRFVSRTAQHPLALIINPKSDLIVEGWKHPDLQQNHPGKIVINGSFTDAFVLSLHNLNPNFAGDASLYFMSEFFDETPTQMFPHTSRTKKLQSH